MAEEKDDGPRLSELTQGVIRIARQAERQKIVDDLLDVYRRRVDGRRGKRPNRMDDFLAATIQRIAGVDPAEAAAVAALEQMRKEVA